MQGYAHLAQEERYHIEMLHKEGRSMRSIAAGMGRCPSTISRELKRNASQRGYRHQQTGRKAREHLKSKPKCVRMTQETAAFMDTRLADGCRRSSRWRAWRTWPRRTPFWRRTSRRGTTRSSCGPPVSREAPTLPSSRWASWTASCASITPAWSVGTTASSSTGWRCRSPGPGASGRSRGPR